MNYNCIICDFEIKQIDISLSKEKPEQGCYNEGIVERIYAGYGSKLDGDMFVIAICDKYIDEKTKSGQAKYVGDYIFPEQDVIGYIGLNSVKED